MEDRNNYSYLEDITRKQLLRFTIPSIAGLLLFLIPFTIDGQITLLLNLLINWTSNLLGTSLIPCIIVILSISAIVSVLGLIKPSFFKGYWQDLFVTSPFMVAVRISAVILGILIFLNLGPEVIWEENTGGSVLNNLLANLTPFFLWAGLLFPLLTEFGLMEFIGTLMSPILRPVFKIPGHAAVNCALAWMGSATFGVAFTSQQYEKGYYTGREAISIATGFTVTSIPMVVVFSKILGIPQMFTTVYASFIVVGFLTNFIMVRIPPLSRKPEHYLVPHSGSYENENSQAGILTRAVLAAVSRNETPPGKWKWFSGLKLTGNIWFTLEPLILVLGTIAMIIAEYTPAVDWLAYPFIFILSSLGVPEAVAAAPAMVIGFFDAFLPIIVGAGIGSEFTKFVILIVSLVQIIFMTGTGPLILKSKMPVNFLDLVMIFLLRTLIAIPVTVGLGYLIF